MNPIDPFNPLASPDGGHVLFKFDLSHGYDLRAFKSRRWIVKDVNPTCSRADGRRRFLFRQPTRRIWLTGFDYRLTSHTWDNQTTAPVFNWSEIRSDKTATCVTINCIQLNGRVLVDSETLVLDREAVRSLRLQGFGLCLLLTPSRCIYFLPFQLFVFSFMPRVGTTGTASKRPRLSPFIKYVSSVLPPEKRTWRVYFSRPPNRMLDRHADLIIL